MLSSIVSWLSNLFGPKQPQPIEPESSANVQPVPTPQPVQPEQPEVTEPTTPEQQQSTVTPVATKPTPFVVTPQQLIALMPVGARKGVDFEAFAAAINKVFALPAVNITTDKQAAVFLSESAYESSEYTRLREVWNPAQVPQQKAYEGSKTLGNTEPGDGYKFRGGGLPQLTGRWNYTAFSKWSGVDFVNNPDWIAQPYYAALAFGWYWSYKKLAQYALTQSIGDEVRAINGPGMLGLADRQKYYDAACKILGVKWA